MITEADLYYMGQESEEAHKHMRELCLATGHRYPPQPEPHSNWRNQLPDPLTQGQLQ